MNDVTFIDDNIGFVCGAGGRIAKTTDAGVNWTVLNSGTTRNLYAIDFIDSNIGWATGDQNTILKTTDGGNTWSIEPEQINGVSIRAIVGFTANNALAMDYGTIAKYISTASPGGVVNVSCNGGSDGQIATLVTGGTAPYTYSWSPSGGTTDTASGLSAGSFTLTVTDANNCSSTSNYTVSEPTLLTATQTQTDVTCFGLSNGSATVTASGGTAPYTYAWSPSGGTNATAINLSAGNYTCTITDANGCTLIENFTITEPSLVPSPTAPATQLFCPGATVATLQATGATGETIEWFTAPTGGTALTSPTALAVGTYYAQAVNNNGCNSVRTPVVVATNNSLDFDGINDFVEIPDANELDVTTAFTIEAWVYPTTTSTGQVIIGKINDTTLGNAADLAYALRFNSSGFRAEIGNGTTSQNVTSSNYQLNKWQHVAMVFDGANAGNLSLYIDGVLQGNTLATGWSSIQNNSASLKLGSYGTHFNQFFKGGLDNFRIWNIAKTATEINTLINEDVTGTETGLVANYNFNQGVANGSNTSITTLFDNTNTPNNGSLNNFSLAGNASNFVGGRFPEISGLTNVVAGNTISLSHIFAGGTWSSATPSVATVNPSTGEVT
jgi:hypothetical protein